ncbi:MAG: COX15/CtaA family protein [Candidatus Dormibacteraceae bacterium]
MRAPTFRRLAAVTAGFAFCQIALGAVVRVSGSGLGCGNSWPLCHGHLYPDANPESIIEYAHRTVGSLTGVLLVATVVVAWLAFRRTRPGLAWLATAAGGTIVIEGLLGGLVVFRDLASPLVLVHLAVAEALVALLLTAALLSLPVPAGERPPGRSYRRLTIVALGLTYVLILTGSSVVASSADSFCKSWPLCGGGFRFDFQGVNAFNMLHRLMAGAVGLLLLHTLSLALRRWRSVPGLGWAAGLTIVALLAQIGIGYPAAIFHDVGAVNGAHVAAATAVWLGMVATAVLANRRYEAAEARAPAPAAPLGGKAEIGGEPA